MNACFKPLSIPPSPSKQLSPAFGGFMGKKLYIGNLPYSVTEEGLADTFASCGTVESVRIVTDRETGRSKGFAFVEMGQDAEAQSVISKFNGTAFGGRAMNISEARPQAPRTQRY
jgi:RNA recognition motif-containing protein